MSHIFRPLRGLIAPSSGEALSRRRFLLLNGLAAAALLSSQVPGWAATPSQPKAADFRNGDLIWPARPGTYIPFARTRSLQQPPEVADWEREKREFIEGARQSGNPELEAVADEVERMSFEEFQARYFGGSGQPGSPGAPRTRGFSPFGAALPQVGHVAIIEVDGNGVRWVIEAMPKAQRRYESLYSRFPNGVIRTRYDTWITEHKDYNIWHGRVRDADRARASRIVAEAKRFLGKDYWFWSFDLSNDAAFYCSKLVWVSVFRAIGVALDGDPNFVRKFWVTPAELINSSLVEVLHSPGVYGRQ